MKQYSHDYTLPSLAESLLQTAEADIRFENYDRALKAIADARHTLQQYLSQDNMVEDSDLEDGWVRAKDIVVTIIGSDMAKATEHRVEKPGPKIEKHRQIDSRYLKQKTDGANPENPLYKKIVVMSGTFGHIKMERDDVAAALQALGAKVNRSVSNTIQVFVQGDRAGKSKVDEVMALRASGRDVRIITPVELKEIIDKYLSSERVGDSEK